METAVKYMQNKYDIFRRLLKTSMWYRVAIALSLSDDKAVNSTIFKNSFNPLRNILLYLLIYCLLQPRMYQSRVHKVGELLDIWNVLQQNAVDSAIDGECVFAPAYGPKADIF